MMPFLLAAYQQKMLNYFQINHLHYINILKFKKKAICGIVLY